MVHLQPDMNHMLLDDANGSPANYVRLPSRKLNAQALRLLSDWLADQLRR
jgi:hypothetical protein